MKMRNSPKKGNSKKIITEKYAFLVEKNAAIIETYAFKPFSPDFIKLIVRRFEEQLFKAENYWNFNLENEIRYYIKYFKTSKRYVEQLKRFLTLNGSNALDSAGGGGGFAVALALAGANVTFVDVNPSDIRLSRQAAREHKVDNINFILADVRKLPLKTSTFDICIHRTMWGSSIATRADKALRENWRTLRGGGIMYLSTYNRLFPIDFYETKLWFINYMPRRLALLYGKLCGRLAPETGIQRYGILTYWNVIQALGGDYALLQTFRSSHLKHPFWGPAIKFLSWITGVPTTAFCPSVSFVAKKMGC